jgi:hypothetical protein
VAARKKPAPDIHQWVLAQMGLPLGEALAMEDLAVVRDDDATTFLSRVGSTRRTHRTSQWPERSQGDSTASAQVLFAPYR